MSQSQEIAGIMADLKKKYGKDVEKHMAEFCDLPQNKALIWKDGFEHVSDSEIKKYYENPKEAYENAKKSAGSFLSKEALKAANIDTLENWLNSDRASLRSKDGSHYIHKTETIGYSELLYDTTDMPFQQFIRWASEKHSSKAYSKDLEDKRYFDSNNNPVVATFIDQKDNRAHVIVKRTKRGDYAVGIGYDFKDGAWGQGRYDFASYKDALSSLKKDYKVRKLSVFEIYDLDVKKMKNTKHITMNKDHEPKVPPIKEEKQTCLGRTVLRRFSSKNKDGVVRDHVVLDSKVKGYFFDISQVKPVKGQKDKPYLARLVSKKGMHEVWFTSKDEITSKTLGLGEKECIRQIEKFKNKEKEEKVVDKTKAEPKKETKKKVVKAKEEPEVEQDEMEVE